MKFIEPKRAHVIVLLWLSGTVLAIFMLGIMDARATAIADVPNVIEPTAASVTEPNCRFGVSPLSPGQVPWVSTVGAGWYLNFGPVPPDPPPGNGAEFAHVINVRQDKTAGGQYLQTYTVLPSLPVLGSLVDTHLGALWLVGNEPDRGPNPGEISVGAQDDTYPQIYAVAYHEVYHFIKGRDPTAQVANAGLVEVTPGRLQYLDIVWDTYLQQYGVPMPVDAWNTHLYVLSEANASGQPNAIANVAVGTDVNLARTEPFDPDGPGPLFIGDTCVLEEVICVAEHDDMNAFTGQVRAMRSWMKAHGQQNKPLIITEFSQLFPYELDPGGTCFLQDEFGNCFIPSRVTQFTQNAINYLATATDPNLGLPQDNYRLVQQWMWFSVYWSGAGQVSSLVDSSLTTLTQVGQTYQNELVSRQTPPNLAPVAAPYAVGFTVSPSATTTVTLSLDVTNNGDTNVTTPFTVTFFSDQNLTLPIGSATIADLGGCARRHAVVTTTWVSLTTGHHPFWAKIDSGGDVPNEIDLTDNLVAGFAIIDPEQVSLPLVVR